MAVHGNVNQVAQQGEEAEAGRGPESDAIAAEIVGDEFLGIEAEEGPDPADGEGDAEGPASTRIIAVTPASTNAVPRSGWATTSTMNSPGISAAGASVCFQSRMAPSRVCKNHARKSTSTGFAISEG